MPDSLSRLNFVALAAGTAASFASIGLIGSPASAAAAEYRLKFANDLPPDHPTNTVAHEVALEIASKSNGRVEMQVFPANQLGNDTQMLSQLRSGAIQFMAVGDNILATLVPAAAISNVGFTWPDSKTVFRALDGDLGAYIRGEIEATGVHPMNKIWDEGFREMTSSTKPLKTSLDLAGFKMRVPPSPSSTALFAALGAAPTTINLKDLYSSLETHIVDGQENGLLLIEDQKLFEVQKYCSMTDHMFVGYWILANSDYFNKLPKDLQSIVSAAFDAGALKQRAESAAENKGTRAKLIAKGLTIIDVDRTGFRETLVKAGFYKRMGEQFGAKAWSLLEQYVGKLN